MNKINDEEDNDECSLDNGLKRPNFEYSKNDVLIKRIRLINNAKSKGKLNNLNDLKAYNEKKCTCNCSCGELNQLLLKTLTEVLTNQLSLQRKIDNLIEFNQSLVNLDPNDEDSYFSNRNKEQSVENDPQKSDIGVELSPSLVQTDDQYSDGEHSTRYSSIPNSQPFNSLSLINHDIDNLLHLNRDAEELVSKEIIKRCLSKAKHRGNFAANLTAELFTKEERINGNCTGTRGKRQLSPRRLQLVKDITFQLFSCQSVSEYEDLWKKECITAIDAKNRSILREVKHD